MEAQHKPQLPSESMGKGQGPQMLGKPTSYGLCLAILPCLTVPEHCLLYFPFQGNTTLPICSPVPHTSPPGEEIDTMYAYTIITLVAAALGGQEDYVDKLLQLPLCGH